MRISKKNAIKRMIKNNLKRILDMQIGKQYFSLKSRVDWVACLECTQH